MPELPPQQPPKPESETRKHFDLATLLTYENPNAERIHQLVEQAAENPFAVIDSEHGMLEWQYIRNVAKEDPISRECLKFLEEQLQGILCNLGAKGSPVPYMLDGKGPQVILSVDIDADWPARNPADLDPKKILERKIDEREGCEVLQVKSDMLDFISRVASGSTHIEIDAIDNVIIKNPEYHAELAKEIKRVVKPGGIVFGVLSNVFAILKRDSDFTDIYPNETLGPNYFVLQKKKTEEK